MQPAFYDPTISYEDNYEKGPPVDFQKLTPPQRIVTNKYKFLGFDINVPFGIPPGPLLNSKFIKAAFAWGYDVIGYKTVRSQTFPCHQHPNVLFVDTEGELHPENGKNLVGSLKTPSKTKFSITNSFGVPSKEPAVWQEDVKKALSYQGEGQLMLLSFMGTVKENQTQEEFVNDFILAAKLSAETGARALEANLSCPNIGNEGLVCYNLEVTEAIVKGIRSEIGEIPLVMKVGYYKNTSDLERLGAIANEHANAIAFINAIQNKVVDTNGEQALPGKNRLVSGIAGTGIKWAGLEMTKKLHSIRVKNKYNFELMSMGGVITPEDYLDYREAGADVVQAATGSMWNPHLATAIGKLNK